MRKRLLILSLAISLVGLLVFSLVSADIYYQSTINSFEDTLKVHMNVYEEGITANENGAREMSDRLEGARVTFLDKDGNVLVDTEPGDESYSDSEEIILAILYGEGFSVREAGLNKNTAFYCRKYGDVLVRISLPTPSQWAVFSKLMPTIIWVLMLDVGLCFAFAFLLTGFVLRPLEKMTKEAASDSKQNVTSEYSELYPLAEIINDMKEQMAEKIRKLDDESKMQSLLLNSMEHGIIIWDANGNVKLINEAANKLTGGNLYEQEIGDIVSDGGAAYKTIFDREYLFRITHSGSSRVLLITDVTDIRRAEKSKNDFIANVTHEMNTPLTSIKGFAELIGSGSLNDEKVKTATSIIISQSDKLASLIKSIINYSEIDSDDLPPYEINLSEILIDAIKVFEPQINTKSINLVMDVAPDVKIMSRYERVNEIAGNLISNAIRYNKEGGEIKVILTENSLVVSDTGIGISEENQKRIFDRFYTVDKSHSGKGGGFGLGLAIVKKLCNKAGYTLRVESKEGVGTTFTVVFNK